MIYIEYSIEVIPYTVKQLAAIYRVKPRVFNTWLDKFRNELGKPEGHYYLIPQVKLIFRKLDLPGHFIEENPSAAGPNAGHSNFDKAA